LSDKPAPTLDVQVYDDVIAVLGGDKVRDLVLKLEARLARSFAIPDPAALERTDLAREAHALVSQAGALGFEELGETCRDLEAACLVGEEEVLSLLDEARAARDRALREIENLKRESRQSAA
jgi:HPt (histidine-containing phosphotransfer) domain-containing protein